MGILSINISILNIKNYKNINVNFNRVYKQSNKAQEVTGRGSIRNRNIVRKGEE